MVKNCYFLIKLYIYFAFAFGMSWSHAKNIEFLNSPISLFKISNNDKCSLVNVHTLYQANDGNVLHQQGVGWVTYTPNQIGVVTPFHVVTHGEMVVAECDGRYFNLIRPVIDAERDIAYFQFQAGDQKKLMETVTPLIFALNQNDEDIKQALRPTDPQKAVLYFNFERKDLDQQLFELMLGVINFGIVGPPNPDTGQSSVLMSPINNDIVQGLVDKNQSYIKNLIRIENMGIRPGQSGSALFGVPYHRLMMTTDLQGSTLNAPLEMIPKVVLGMITKTRLNGAQTIALSIGDIYDFLEERVVPSAPPKPQKNLRINYAKALSSHLQSYITLHPKGENEVAIITEYCSEDFKSSAEFKPTKTHQLLKMFGLKKNDAKDIEVLRGVYSDLSWRNDHLRHDMKHLQRSGGGEYGEGGDGFLSPHAEFLTSSSRIGNFSQRFWKFTARQKADSFGLYLIHKSCRARGLLLNKNHIKNRLIHSVHLPNKKPIRMVNFEDLLHFQKTHQEKTLDLLLNFGRVSYKPFFTDEMKNNEAMRIPLSTAQVLSSDDENWKISPGRMYLKQKLVMHPPGATSADSLFLSKETLDLSININSFSHLKRKDFQDRLVLKYKNNQWKAALSLGLSCRMELEPEFFKQVNPYYVHYDDGKNKMSVELASQDRFIAVNIMKSSCPELKDLALLEIEIHLVPGLSAVVGTNRLALIPRPINLEAVKKDYLEPQQGAK